MSAFLNSFGYSGKNTPTLVFIHGAGMDSTVWSQQARYFAARGQRVIAPDLPEHGRSGGKRRKTIADMAKWLDKQLKGSARERPILIGHSMGALIALEASAHVAPGHVVLIGAAASMPVHPQLLTAAEENLPVAAAMIAEWSYARGQSWRGQAIPGTSLALAAQRLLEASKPGVLANDLAACAAYDNAVERARAVDAPLSVINGDQDRMTPLSGARKLALSGNGALHVIAAGHMAMLERPMDVRRLLAGISTSC